MKTSYIAITILVLAVLGGTYYYVTMPTDPQMEIKTEQMNQQEIFDSVMTPEEEVVATEEAEATIDAQIDTLDSISF